MFKVSCIFRWSRRKTIKTIPHDKSIRVCWISSNNLWLQPEGYNPSGSFKDNGMATAVTHAKIVGAKKIVCASTGNTSASAGMFAANEGIDCDVYIPAGQIAPGKLKSSISIWRLKL